MCRGSVKEASERIEKITEKDSGEVAVGGCGLMEINGIRQMKVDGPEGGQMKMVECRGSVKEASRKTEKNMVKDDAAGLVGCWGSCSSVGMSGERPLKEC